MRAGIVDYRMGNLASVAKALERVGVEPVVSDDPAELASTELVVLPGVGNFTAGMENLKRNDLDDFVIEWAKGGQPFIGICLGMQLLFDHSEEGDTPGLGILPGEVKRMAADVKVPHMGWNDLSSSTSRFFQPFVGRHFYFVHSYVCEPAEPLPSAISSYGKDFVAGIESERIFGFQFHPEKSSSDGIALLAKAVEGTT